MAAKRRDRVAIVNVEEAEDNGVTCYCCRESLGGLADVEPIVCAYCGASPMCDNCVMGGARGPRCCHCFAHRNIA